MPSPQENRQAIFESCPIPRAVATLSVPTVLSSLVTVLYSLADTYFVGLLNDPVQTAAVTLAAPVLLAFNAVNNLFAAAPPSGFTAPSSPPPSSPSCVRCSALPFSPCWGRTRPLGRAPTATSLGQ